jgi:cytoskeletal protein RodZ
VADNVIFGEDATLYAFLVLLGILIIVAAFSQRILEKTSLNKIQSELEVDEGSTESDDSSKKVKDENGNKVDKDNIVGDNKK